jgi:hypothetical protein
VRKAIIIAVVLVPVLLGLVASLDGRPKRGLFALLASVILFQVGQAAVLYLLWLRMSD